MKQSIAQIEISSKIDYNKKLYGISLIDRAIRSAQKWGAATIIVPKEVKSIKKYAQNQVLTEKANTAENIFLTNRIYNNNALSKGLSLEEALQFEINSEADFREVKRTLFQSCRKSGNFVIDTLWFDGMGSNLARLIAKLNVTPNMVTFMGLLVAIAACISFSQGTWLRVALGGILVHVGFILDSTDGRLARLKGLSSNFGAFFDGILDSAASNLWLLGMIIALYKTSSNPLFPLLGLFALIGDNITTITFHLSSPEAVDAGGSAAPSKATNHGIKRFLLKLSQFMTYYEVRLFLILIFSLINRLDILIVYFAIIFNLNWIAVVFLKWWKSRKNV